MRRPLNGPEDVRDQYSDSANLTARANLHARFSTNRYGAHEWAFDHLDLAADARVLEVGCGPGWLWGRNVGRMRAGQRVVCSDVSAGMVGEARAALQDKRLDWVVADVQTLPFESGRFDAVVANHVLYHVPDLPTAVRELARVLCGAGRLFATTNGRRHLVEIRQLLDDTEGHPVSPNAEVFGLETGPAALEPAFEQIEVLRHEDALRVTEVEPLMDYIRSMSSFWPLEKGRQEAIRNLIAQTIENRGSFDIQKDSGLIRARRREG